MVSVADGVSATLVQISVFRSATQPVPNKTGDLWIDISGATPVYKYCSSMSPITFLPLDTGGGGGISDGDKGDITVSGSGTVWTIDPTVVTNAKLDTVPANTLKGNNTGVTAAPLDLTAAQVRTLINVADGATANSTDAFLLARANHTGTQTASTISDFSEAVDDRVASLLVAGANITLTYNDAAGTLTIDSTSGGGISDGDKGDITVSSGGTVWTIDNGVVGTTKLGGDITTAGKALLDDADASAQRTTLGLGTAATANTEDFAAVAHTHTLANVTDVTITVANLNSLDDGVNSTLHFHNTDRDRANHTGTQTASTISDFNTSTDSRISAAVGVSVAAQSHVGSSGTSHANATTSVAGFMSSTDKTKLDGIASGAEVNVNADWNSVSGDSLILNKPTIPTLTSQLTNDSGFLTSTAGNWSGTFDGQEGTFYLARANHTGTQTSSTISDFSEAVDDRVNSLLIAGANITLTYDDPTNTLTIASSGGGISDGDKGDITVSSSGAIWTVDAGAITLAKQANLAANSIQGNNTGSPATPIALTGTQTTAMLDVFTSSLKGLAPASGGGTTNFLRADGIWAAPSGGSGSLDIGLISALPYTLR